MNRRLSLQWRLTAVTALMVIVSCLLLSYFISKSALLYMGEIEDSAIAILPSVKLPENFTGDFEVRLDPKAVLSDMIQSTQTEFWTKSLLITLIITLVSSAMMYFIIGSSLQPLRRLGRQIEDIQAKNLRRLVASDGSSAEIVQLTDAFNAMLKRLGDTLSAQRQFSANAAHELRTPLAVMRTRLEVFEKSDAPEIEEYRELLGMIRAQTNRLSQVIDILLEMTELQAAEKGDTIRLSEMAEEVVCDLTAVANKRDIRLIQKPGSAEITGNDTLVYRAIYNLVENAIKYNRPGGEVSIEVKEDEEFASVFISDTGTGIDRADWEQIFEPFFRVDKSRSREMGGSGLGLALVKEIAQQHGGAVRVRKSTEQGTQMELLLKGNGGRRGREGRRNDGRFRQNGF